MRTTINLPDDLIRETEAVYKADSRSQSIAQALKDALRQKKLEQLKDMIGKIEFNENTITEMR